MMLGNSPVYANIPVTDMEKSKKFYIEVLGLKLEDEKMQGVALLNGGNSTKILLYQRPPVTADHTFASFVVDDIYASVKELKAKGIVFEQYDMGQGFKTNDEGVMEMGPTKAAWFKDPDGHVLALNSK